MVTLGLSEMISTAVKYRTLSPANTVTSLFRSLWRSPESDLNNEVLLCVRESVSMCFKLVVCMYVLKVDFVVVLFLT